MSDRDEQPRPLVSPPARIPWVLRPALWIARKITQKDPLPARLLAHFTKGALAVGVFEAAAPHAPADLDARVLAAARIVASAVGGCPFCVDMNASTWKRAGLTPDELASLVALEHARWDALGPRESSAARYADALSRTPVAVTDALRDELRQRFTEREIVVLAMTIAQVNFWTRFNQGLGVEAAGFFDERACPTVRLDHRARGLDAG